METIDLTTDEATPDTAKRAPADLPTGKDALACRACRACTLVTNDATRTQCELCGCELPELSKRRRIESFFKLRTESPPPAPSPAASPTPTPTPTASRSPTPSPALTPAPAPTSNPPVPTPTLGETAGWHVHLSGRLQPYPPREQLVLEHAWQRGLPKASVTVDGMRFDVLFEAAGGVAAGNVATGPHAPVAVQWGRAQQRNVHRVPPSRARPEPPLLAAARRVARITRADEVSEPWEQLAQATAALDEARRRVAARRGAWVEEAKRLRALDGLKVAVVGTSLLGSRGVLHDAVLGAGGAIPTHTQPAEKKVNSQTDLLLVGTLIRVRVRVRVGVGVGVRVRARAC